uniref:Transposase n=1 Tax=Chenopodium quinoa TaxID=63459 RepID=A0A803MDI9_CHEQI
MSRQFHIVLQSILKIGKHYIKQVDQTTSFAEDNKWKWFEGVVGALDGTHIKMTVPIEDRPRYRDRKGDLSTNVLAACDSDLRFTYVLPGWEGSVSDPRVLHDALRRPNGLKIPRRTMTSKRQGKQPMGPPNRRGYVSWNSKMDEILTSTLFEQINEGNKGDGDFKSQAYQAVVDKLRDDLGMSITVDHVRNRIKVWKKHYSVITEIRTNTKFKWDEKKKMVVIPAEQLADWYTYCTDAPQAAAYQNKFIENWDDIFTLFASDRATGEGVEQHEEAAAAMENENDNASTSEASSGGLNKKLKRDRLADAVS